MNICLLTRYFDYRGTGITRISTEVLKGLVKRGHSVRMIETRGSSLSSYFFYTLFEIPRKLPRNGIDVYHAITSPMEGMWLPRDKAVVTYCDTIPILHPDRFGSGMGYSQWRNWVGRKYSEFGWRRAKRASVVTCLSEQTRDELMDYFGVPGNKIEVIRMGIRGDLEPRPKEGKKFRIGTLGQLDKRKRIDLLIEAFKRSRLDWELVIAGKGMDEPLLHRLAEGDRRIKFLGMVPDDELCAFYNSLDVFVFPSAAEGLGLPPVEAFACRKPVVVLEDAVIPPEVKNRCVALPHLGLMFSNPDYIKGRIKSVDYDGNYQFAKLHSWDGYVDELVELYEGIVEENEFFKQKEETNG